MISPNSTIGKNVIVGEECKVWQYATICDGTILGDHVVVGSCVWIGKGCVIGDGVRIQHGAFIPNNCVIEEDVFIGPNVTLTDDLYPRAGQPYKPTPSLLEKGCSLGAGCTVLPGVVIGRHAMVGAGAVVTQDVQPYTKVKGVPAGV